ncbi:MAG: ATP-binding cassette domain-containing protein [Deltaproteobacteria bacterium]|jgi:D-methionine transport system ATP-binding protein|nr:ATP-binding cassette domain-containing protein [Deltaproteobacteria bacterium]
MTHLIEIKGLTKTFNTGADNVEALRGIDLTIDEGEIFGVIGLSGAGKSTFIRCLNRLETPSSGQVLVAGRDLTTLSRAELLEARRSMGMIFQSFNLLSSRNVWANVAFPLQMDGRPKAFIRQRVAELLEMVGLTDKAKAYPSQLSGGQKQRVGIARSLANSPTILLCDEATSSLDPQTTSSILSLIEDLKERLSLTVVLITHEMKVITEICDRVAVMENGQIVETGRVIDVFTSPKHPTSKSFVEVVLSNTDHFLEKGYQPKGLLVRIGYIGPTVIEPLVYTLIKKFNVETNILQAHIDHIKGTPYGTLLLDLSGQKSSVDNALDYLRNCEVNLEVFNVANPR